MKLCPYVMGRSSMYMFIFFLPFCLLKTFFVFQPMIPVFHVITGILCLAVI